MPRATSWHRASSIFTRMRTSRWRRARTPLTQLYQGVTTLVTGNCGWSPFPITDLDQMRAGTAFLAPEHAGPGRTSTGFADTLDPAWRSTSPCRSVTRRSGSRSWAAPSVRRPRPSSRRCRTLLREAAEQGAVGFSTGLIYAPGTYAEPSEVAALVATAAECGLLYSTHIRNEGAAAARSPRRGDRGRPGRRCPAGGLAPEGHGASEPRDGHGRARTPRPGPRGRSRCRLRRLSRTRPPAPPSPPGCRPGRWTAVLRPAGPARRHRPNAQRVAGRGAGAGVLDPDDVVIASLPPGRYQDCRGLSLAEIARRDGVDGAEIVPADPGAPPGRGQRRQPRDERGRRGHRTASPVDERRERRLDPPRHRSTVTRTRAASGPSRGSSAGTSRDSGRAHPARGGPPDDLATRVPARPRPTAVWSNPVPSRTSSYWIRTRIARPVDVRRSVAVVRRRSSTSWSPVSRCCATAYRPATGRGASSGLLEAFGFARQRGRRRRLLVPSRLEPAVVLGQQLVQVAAGPRPAVRRPTGGPRRRPRRGSARA